MPTSSASKDGPCGSSPKPSPWSDCAWVQLSTVKVSPSCARCSSTNPRLAIEFVRMRRVGLAARDESGGEQPRAGEHERALGGSAVDEQIREQEGDPAHRVDAGERRDLVSPRRTGFLLDEAAEIAADERGVAIGRGRRAARAGDECDHRPGDEPDDDGNGDHGEPASP